jgi:hypothetical protein
VTLCWWVSECRCYKGQYSLHLQAWSRARWLLTLKMKALQAVIISGTTQPTTHHIPRDLNPQQHCCEDLNSCKCFICLDTSYMHSVWRASCLAGHVMFVAVWHSHRQWNSNTAVRAGIKILTAHILSLTRPTKTLWYKDKENRNFSKKLKHSPLTQTRLVYRLLNQPNAHSLPII